MMCHSPVQWRRHPDVENTSTDVGVIFMYYRVACNIRYKIQPCIVY